MEKKIMYILVGIFAAAISLNSLFYTVDETEQVVVVRFGEIITTDTEAGLKIKLPFIESVEVFEKRLLEYDAAPKEIISQDKKTLVVDNFARWRISDLKTFYERVRTENLAQNRLDEIIYSDLRNELGKYTFNEIISENRQDIMDQVAALSNIKTADLGIEIVDVRIKRADLPPENEAAVFERMRAERRRQANLSRSEGEEESLKIRAETDKQATIIQAEAYQISQQVRGEGDATALKIYADAYNRDPDFFQFMRTLEAYEKTLKDETTVVLSPDSDFLRYLTRIQ